MCIMVFFLFILLSLPAAFAEELCFPTQIMADVQARRWNDKAKFLVMKFLMVKRATMPTTVRVSRKCNQCVVVEGDPYIAGIFKEEHLEKEKEYQKMLEEKPLPKDFKVDVTMGRLYPDHDMNGKAFYNNLYRPFLRYPGSLQNVFYTPNDTPIYVSAKFLNEKYMVYTFILKELKHSIITEVGARVGCMFPYDDETIKQYPYLKGIHSESGFHMKELDKNHAIEFFELKSMYRHFYWPDEIKQEESN